MWWKVKRKESTNGNYGKSVEKSEAQSCLDTMQYIKVYSLTQIHLYIIMRRGNYDDSWLYINNLLPHAALNYVLPVGMVKRSVAPPSHSKRCDLELVGEENQSPMIYYLLSKIDWQYHTLRARDSDRLQLASRASQGRRTHRARRKILLVKTLYSGYNWVPPLRKQ